MLHPPEHEKETYQDVEEKAKSGESKVAKSSSRDWRVETFIVGKDVARGEKVQWIVEGGKYKASYLLPDSGSVEELWDSERGSKNGLLISETVVPGFEFSDHDFLTAKRFVEVVGKERVAEMGWLLGKEEGESSGQQSRCEGLGWR